MPNISISADGPDDIPARILKMAAHEIAPALPTIFNKFVESGTLPDIWRRANIYPVFKKGDRTKPSNYRPVLLLCIVCKGMEHVDHSNIMHHLNQYDILTDKQHGFCQQCSCESQLILTVHDLAKTLDKRLQTDVIKMDFSKAFDVDPHQRLLLKLAIMVSEDWPIRGLPTSWSKKCRGLSLEVNIQIGCMSNQAFRRALYSVHYSSYYISMTCPTISPPRLDYLPTIA